MECVCPALMVVGVPLEAVADLNGCAVAVATLPIFKARADVPAAS